MSFFDDLERELKDKKTMTTNGAIAYETSGKKILDFNFVVSAMRKLSSEEIMNIYATVFYEDKKTAIEYLFYVGDIRGGLGERRTFRCCLLYLISNHPEIAKAIMPIVPYYNRWDSMMLFLYSDETMPQAIKLLKQQLEKDNRDRKDGKPISLCAKWMPSINTSSINKRKIAKLLCRGFGWTEKKYRKRLSKLRKYLDVVEVKMSKNEWGEINYETVPSKANLIYSNAFLRNDAKRRSEYLKSLARNEVKINASVLNPDEICKRYRANSYMCCVNEYDETLEQLWKALPDLSVENTLVVRDGSGSMTWERLTNGSTPLDVATALAIYMSEHNTGEWKDKYITFSSDPKIVDLSKCKNLKEKIELSMNEADCSNTDIYKTMMLILKTAKRNNLTSEEMPKMIVICSDMQFDGRYHNFTQSLFDRIKEKFKEAGYKLPRICFWNLSGRVDKTIPLQENELGLILCSGFSVQIMKMFMSNNTDPYKVLLDTLHSARYDLVRETIENII